MSTNEYIYIYIYTHTYVYNKYSNHREILHTSYIYDSKIMRLKGSKLHIFEKSTFLITN